MGYAYCQAAVESIRPGVIGAGHSRDVTFRLQADPRSAVAADIEMGVDGVAVSAHHDDLFTRNLKQEVVALVGDATDVIGVLPLPGKQVGELFFEDLR